VPEKISKNRKISMISKKLDFKTAAECERR
jgi:hypothetical protein